MKIQFQMVNTSYTTVPIHGLDPIIQSIIGYEVCRMDYGHRGMNKMEQLLGDLHCRMDTVHLNVGRTGQKCKFVTLVIGECIHYKI